MATVNSGRWVGSPSAPGQTQSNRDRASAQQGQIDALGYIPDSQREKRTGVDPGAGGYVSGQAPPGGAAPVTAAPTGGTARGAPAPYMAGNTPATSTGGYVGGGMSASGSPSNTPAPTVGGYSGGGAPPPGTPAPSPASDIETKMAALSAPGSAGTTTSTGTVQGKSPIPTGGDISPTVRGLNYISPGLGDKVDVGSNLLRPTQADLSPTIAAQNAAFGLGSNLDQERYDYRPGAAAAQDRVALNTTDADATRARQQQALDALTAAANGTTVSPAELQMRQEAGRNVAATLGQARALGGRSAGGAARAGTLASADILANNDAEAARLRATETANARNQLATALGAVRGQDVETAAKNADLNQAANANNLNSQIQQNDLAEKHRQELIEAQLKAYGIGTAAAGHTVDASAANAAADNKLKGGIVSTVGQMFGL